eukprot:2524539-Rhodomonas_salina.1
MNSISTRTRDALGPAQRLAAGQVGDVLYLSWPHRSQHCIFVPQLLCCTGLVRFCVPVKLYDCKRI